MGATYLIDIDGCIVFHGTNNLLPGAQELLDKIISSGGKIVFTTRRGDKEFKGHKIYSAESAQQLVRSLRVPYEALILDVDSPRVVINDDVALAFNHKTNGSWEIEEINKVLS
jgi:ribonucleotide monophosphatase NagD (HAD superfamily)